MTNKTPLQELIRIMEETVADSRCDIIIAKAIRANIKLATALLEKEKNIIVDAWNKGNAVGYSDGTNDRTDNEDSGIKYFNQTFKP